MATLQEINAKRKELMGTGQFANEKEAAIAARNQLTSVAPTTGAGATPTPPTPSPTLATNQAQLAENQANRAMNPMAQTPAPITPMPVAPVTPTPQVTGVDGQKFVQAEVDPNTGLSKVQAPTPQPMAPTPAPTPTNNPIAPVSKEAEIKAKNEAQMALNKQQADQRQAERDKVTQEANNQLANSETAILNTLRTGGIIPESVKTSPFYKSAQNTYNKLQQFSTYSTSDLTTALNTGALLPWTSVYNEMLKDPSMKTKLTQAQMYTVWQPVDTNQVFSQVSNEILSNNPTTASYLSDWVITQEEYSQATDNAEIVAKAKDVEEKTNKYNTLKAEYDAIEDEVNAQFPWSPYADSIIADRQKAKYKNLVLAKWEVDSAVGTLTEIKSQASNLFETNLKLYESRRAEQTAREQAVFEANLWLQTKQAEAEMAKEVARESMNDPYTAIPQMIAQYAEMGIPFTRSIQQIIADFESSGQDLATYLTGLQKTIQSKPEYQAMQAYQMRQYAPPAEQAMEYGFSNIGDGKIAITNPKTGQVSFASAGNVSSLNAPTTTSAKMLDIPTWTDVWVQCGTFARQLCGLDATPGGNSLEARVKAFSDTTPQAGGMVLFTGNGYDKTYGHIASVESVNQDGTLNIVESNLKWDNKVTRRTINANDTAISGFYNDTPLAKSAWVQSTGTQAGTQGTTTFTPTEEAWANNIMNGKAKLSDITNKDNVDKWKVLQLMNQKTGGSTGAMQTNLTSWLEIVNSLLNHKWFTDVVWLPSIFTNPFGYSIRGTEARDFKAELARMEAIGFLNMIPQMQWMWALSNAEGSRLAQAYSKLSETWVDEEKYKEELIRLKEWMEKALKAMWATIPEPVKNAKQQTVGGELDYSKYETK